MNVRDKIEYELSNPSDMAEHICYLLYGAVVTTTRGFSKVEVKPVLDVKLIFIVIDLRWVVNHHKMKKIHDVWLVRAEKNCKPYIPENFKLRIRYGNLKYEC